MRKGEQGDDSDARASNGKNHPTQYLRARCSIHQGCLVQFCGDCCEIADHHPCAEGHRECQISDNEAHLGIYKAQLLKNQKQRDEEQGRRQQIRRYNQARRHIPSFEPHTGHRISCERPDDCRDNCDSDRNFKAVQHILQKRPSQTGHRGSWQR